MNQPYPILEFDPNPDSIIESSQLIRPKDVPECCVLCFFQDVITGLMQSGQARVVDTRRSEIGSHLVNDMAVDGRALAVLHPGVGAPLAASLLEELIALDCGEAWDHRDWVGRVSTREALFLLAAQACLALE
jgi:uridine phosphorylase